MFAGPSHSKAHGPGRAGKPAQAAPLGTTEQREDGAQSCGPMGSGFSHLPAR